METFNLLEELTQEKGDLKCVYMDCGDQSVAIMCSLQLTVYLMFSTTLMPWWLAGNLGFHHMVSVFIDSIIHMSLPKML